MMFHSLEYYESQSHSSLEELRDIYHKRMRLVSHTVNKEVGKQSDAWFIQAVLNNLTIHENIASRFLTDFKGRPPITKSLVSQSPMTHAEIVFELKLYPMAYKRYRTMGELLSKLLHIKTIDSDHTPVPYEVWKSDVAPLLKQAIVEKILEAPEEDNNFIINSVENEVSGWKEEIKFRYNISNKTTVTYGSMGYTTSNINEVLKIVEQTMTDKSAHTLVHNVLTYTAPLVTTTKPTGFLKAFKSNTMNNDGKSIAEDLMLLLAIFVDLRKCILTEYIHDLRESLEFWYANTPEG